MRNSNKFFFIISLFFTLSLFSCSNKSEVQGKITYVSDNKVVVGDVAVELDGVSVATSKPLTGNFLIHNVAPGEHILKLKKNGFEELTQPLQIEKGKTLKLNFAMVPETKPVSHEGTNFILLNSQSRLLSTLNLKSGNWGQIVELEASPKEMAFDEDDHHLYLSLPEKNEIAVFDLNQMRLDHRIPLQETSKPTALALSRREDQLISVNDEKNTLICINLSRRQITSPCFNPDELKDPVTVIKNRDTGHFDILGKNAIYETSGTALISTYPLGRTYRRAHLVWLNSVRQYLIHSLVGNHFYLYDPQSKEKEQRLETEGEPIKVLAPLQNAKLYVLFADHLRQYNLYTKNWGPKIETGGSAAQDMVYDPHSRSFYILDSGRGLIVYQPESDKMETLALPLAKIGPDRFLVWG
ncbi:hypothetical protein COW36_23845 [bacterium (Candidatus Blackallbacteria) CG17_big_fil_post_rev_8_21_14_2_50_48_46]|uniref:PEGA domain-containing protein n=1 Tax=bacterium (Candidatus Blackallbacteria) CG17_big_fil_post_rev_8_21_14_2_50_48_46 TaxID=2014261 RepID=A0A2M7FWT4_9BACT|nr:MAG: hypothetical protein COW64_18785 [bacterium (Candidatus Blackallbacteria) CG18_big_fil_WC_8_21_14_2_50_49_26]PIW13707.1 MAG: hypothetical protein COW36_23845 [bacterium (Candidatus Blackallbacteria) CG17_big_fil_post_rev_8_21_14_2_50_48_46]PIW44933.1 MAG: hypothetical protein COW20_21475 [bacterium (Candidatus Blackallbacteria) CG13_big_fil_rev_8_21_14_2_50_49_14]